MLFFLQRSDDKVIFTHQNEKGEGRDRRKILEG